MTTAVTEKRLRNELKDLKKNKLDFAQAFQDENDKFLFYFLLIGDVDDEDPKNKAHSGQYKNGYYLGKILLPQNYPEKPGDFVFMTPSGRFKVGQKICLSNTGYHTETWSPIWSIRNMLLGLVSIFFSDKADAQGANHLQMSKTERLKLAKESIEFNLKNHKNIFVKFDQFVNENGTIKSRTQPDIATATTTPPNVTTTPPNVTPTVSHLSDKKELNDEDDMDLILQQLKKKDEEEAILKKKQDDEYIEQVMKQIEENEKLELLQEVKKIDSIHGTNNINNNQNKLDELDDIYIIEEPEDEPEDEPKKKPKKKESKTKQTIQLKKPVQIVKSTIIKTKTNNVSLDDKIEEIKKMTLKTYDYKVFKEINNLLGLNLNEL